MALELNAKKANAESSVPLPYKTSRVSHDASYAKFGTNAMLMHCKKNSPFLSGSGTGLSALAREANLDYRKGDLMPIDKSIEHSLRQDYVINN